ncbi:MAG TPA: polysaccharide pyruvyl transferase CsaB, partial [Bacillota bacterium]
MAVKRVLISGYYGFGNLGDEALLRAIVQGLRALEPAPVLTVASGDPRRTAAAHRVEAVPR